jgi:hypothetical protein
MLTLISTGNSLLEVLPNAMITFSAKNCVKRVKLS